jgi:hypothetical protein
LFKVRAKSDSPGLAGDDFAWRTTVRYRIGEFCPISVTDTTGAVV